jgi:CubicO group peptidase (beta-lactamase class C family)
MMRAVASLTSFRGVVPALLVAVLAPSAPALAAEVDGERRMWHRVTLTFAGPATGEEATPNPFRDYRLDVTFTHPQSGQTRTVPGFFAADGHAAETSATAGDRWRVHFSPHREGLWRWRVRFRHGRDVAIAESGEAGEAWSPLDGRTGELTIGPSDKTPPDFRARGTLEYARGRYLRFAGEGSFFLKGGVGSPDTLLGYADFDGTWLDRATDRHPPAPNPPIHLPSLKDGLHRYEPHVPDWRPGDPTWKGGKGKGLVGGLNYLASQGVNAVYFLTMNVNGDGRNVWPWTDPAVRDRFDGSKLDQWEIVFSHMTRLGLMLHVVTQETENDHLLDGGDLGPERRLYYRELVARFAHHPAITWNLGEENVQSPAQREAMAAEIRRLDPYRHHVVIHNDHWHAKNLRETFDPLLGFEPFTGTAIQDFHWSDIHSHVRHYVRASARAGHPWVVSADELGGASFGTLPDADDPSHDQPRRFGLWGTLMAGGGGVEWYFGWQNGSPHSDLSAEDWRTREGMYRQTRLALGFFHEHLPFHRMEPADDLVVGHGVFALAAPGEVYAIYLPNGGGTRFDLGPQAGLYEVRWFDPRSGGPLREGSLRRVRGPGLAWTGGPPSEPDRDWLALVRRVEETAPATQFPGEEWRKAEPFDLGIEPAGLHHALNYWRMATGAKGTDRVVVARRGVVVHEGEEAGVAQGVRSVTKSFTSTALGLLLAEKGLSLDTPAAQLEPLLRERYPRATLRHFATMTSGYSAPGGSRWGEPSEDWSQTPYVPGPPLFLPGSAFAYWDEAQMMLGRVLARLAGRDLLALLDERVLRPIGARVAGWSAEGDVDGVPVRNGCTGVTIDPRSLARFGHLFLNGGRWGERQVVPAEWVREATRAQVGAALALADTDRRSLDGRGVYGFNWWANGVRPDGRLALPDAPPGVFYASGLHHNVLVVVPEWDMVIVRLGEGPAPPGGYEGVLNAFLRRLGMAVHPLDAPGGGRSG